MLIPLERPPSWFSVCMISWSAPGTITATEPTSAIRAALAGVEHADAITGAVGPGVNLLDLHVVKGLEFDAVVVVEPATILDERPDGGRGGLYTALSRSTRALAIVHADPLPDALATDPDLIPLSGADAPDRWAATVRTHDVHAV